MTKQQIKNSDKRIAAAAAVLYASQRGQRSLIQFAKFALGDAMGLDSAGHRALLVLFKEWQAGRRDFLKDLIKESEQKMLNDWVPETRSLLMSLQKQGFILYSCDNGENTYDHLAGAPLDKLIAELTACDEAVLYVKHPDTKLKSIYFIRLVYGNSPGELVSDYEIPTAAGVAEKMEAAMASHAEMWESKAQPLKPAFGAYAPEVVWDGDTFSYRGTKYANNPDGRALLANAWTEDHPDTDPVIRRSYFGK